MIESIAVDVSTGAFLSVCVWSARWKKTDQKKKGKGKSQIRIYSHLFLITLLVYITVLLLLLLSFSYLSFMNCLLHLYLLNY